MLQDLIVLVLALAAAGFLLWVVNVLVPMQEPIKRVMNGCVAFVLAIVVVLWILRAVGLWRGGSLVG